MTLHWFNYVLMFSIFSCNQIMNKLFILQIYCINTRNRAFMNAVSMVFLCVFMSLFMFFFSIMNMTAALNKTSIVWQDVFDYHERVSRNLLYTGCFQTSQSSACGLTGSRHFSSSPDRSTWWRFGSRDVTYARCAGWLKQG